MNLLQGDCREVMATLDECSIDAIVTDPPYDLTAGKKGGSGDASVNLDSPAGRARITSGFMGKKWDGTGVAFSPETWSAALRILKPGAHLVAFGAPRTYHRMACAIEDAGFEIRDCLQWLFGSGFPKSLDVSKALDKRGGADIGWFGPWLREERQRRGITQKSLAVHFPSASGGLTGCVANWELGFNLPTVEQFNKLCEVLGLPFARIDEAERAVIGRRDGSVLAVAPGQGEERSRLELEITAASSALARQYSGWGTALKPAYEPIVLARKPLTGTVAANVAQWGTGGLNIDGCRIGSAGGPSGASRGPSDGIYGDGLNGAFGQSINGLGRWPANVLLDDEAAALLDAMSGATGAFAPVKGDGDSGGASRFFYTAKTSKAEREFGLDDLEPARRSDGREKDIENPRLRTNERRNDHPTVKPVDLMRWLCRLITPPGGVILDPFLGSGSTGMAALDGGFQFIGIDMEPHYIEIARRRIARRHVLEPLPQRDEGQGVLL